jgi:sec-independent protein translocase protein TatB
MFDVGPLEVLTLAVIAIVLFGPDKLPEVARSVGRFVRTVREMSDAAKQGLRDELGPEFQDVRLEDLKPKVLLQKHLLGPDGLDGVLADKELTKDIGELRTAFDPRRAWDEPKPTPDQERTRPGERPPFDTDAT